jgi:hypothetical protein
LKESGIERGKRNNKKPPVWIRRPVTLLPYFVLTKLER